MNDKIKLELTKKELDLVMDSIDIFLYDTDKYDNPFIKKDDDKYKVLENLYEKIDKTLSLKD